MKDAKLLSFKKSISAAFVLALLTFAIISMLGNEKSVEFLAIIMTLIGAAYYGFAFKEEEISKVFTELVVSTVFIITAILGLWVSVWFIFAGLLLHGFWDLIHHNSRDLASIPSWYIPFCVVYDWLVAGVVLFLLWG